MKKTNKLLVIIALSMMMQSAYSGSLDDGIAAGDVLSSVLLNNAKAAINDNDSRTTALEKSNGEIRNGISALENEDSAVDGKITRLEDEDVNIRVEIGRLERNDSNFEDRLGDQETVNNDFTTRVEELEQYAETTTGDVGRLQTEDLAIRLSITGVTEDLAAGAAEAADLVSAVSTRIDSIDGVDGEGNRVTDTIEVLRNRVAAIDGGEDAAGDSSSVYSVGVLQNNMNTLKDKLLGDWVTTEVGVVKDHRVRLAALEDLPSVTASAGPAPAVNTTELEVDYPVGSVYTDTRDDGRTSVLRQAVVGFGAWVPMPEVYSVRDHGPASGWVFLTTGDGYHGWEVSPLSVEKRYFTVNPYDGLIAQSINTAYVSRLDNSAIGFTAGNTYRLATSYFGGEAANYCMALDLGGYQDWLLPSLGLLTDLLEELANVVPPIATIAMIPLGVEHLSSSSGAGLFVPMVLSWDGSDVVGNNGELTDDYAVRCVRRF
jgi:hypothetical protein